MHRFTDFMVRDVKTGECYRADHLLEAALETALENTKEPLSPEAAAVSMIVLLCIECTAVLVHNASLQQNLLYARIAA
jgi:glycyl-tRNA synthetase (class II)